MGRDRARGLGRGAAARGRTCAGRRCRHSLGARRTGGGRRFRRQSFDLVSAQYPALLRTPDAAAERALLAAVAPGGVLLLVHHAGMDTQHARENGFDPADYIWPAMVAGLLDDDWAVEVDEQRPRIAPGSGAGAHHAEDLVLRVRRLR